MNHNPYDQLPLPDATVGVKSSLTHRLAAIVLMVIGVGAVFTNFGLLATAFLLMADQDRNVPSVQLAIGFAIWLFAGLCLIKASCDFWLSRPSAAFRATGFAIMISPIPILLFS